MPGSDVVNETTIPITNAPNSIKPIPPGRNLPRSPEKIKAASEISKADGDDRRKQPGSQAGQKDAGRELLLDITDLHGISLESFLYHYCRVYADSPLNYNPQWVGGGITNNYENQPRKFMTPGLPINDQNLEAGSVPSLLKAMGCFG